MIKTIKHFTPPADASAYTPSKTVTVPANGTATVDLQGPNGATFGFDRILPYGLDLLSIEATAQLNNEYTIFKGVQLAAIRQLFLQKKLLAPFIIQSNNSLSFELKNTSGADIIINLQLLGYDAPSLQKLIDEYKAAGIAMPQPAFLYANEEIAAGAANQPVAVPTKSVDVEIIRAAIKTDNDDDITLSLQIYNDTIKNKVFVQQLNDEWLDGYSLVPIKVGKNVPFTLYADNADAATPRTLSFIAETYVYTNQ